MVLVLMGGNIALAQAAGPADLVITIAAIHTTDDANPTAEAVAITGNTISYVGDAAGIAALIGDDTQVIDAEGHLALPGFNETHLWQE